MSMLNHSIPPNGQPLLPAKGLGTQDTCQHLPLAPSCQGVHTLKPFQPNLSKKTPLVIASGESMKGESVYKMSDPKKERFQNGSLEGSINGINSLSHLLSNDIVHDKMHTTSAANNVDFEPIAFHFLCPPPKDAMVELKPDFSSEPNVAVLAIAVSSAVKLEDTQIDLIAQKMQRLTGFRHLRLENVVDPSLIAGFVISYGIDDSHVIDLSVKGQLAALAAQVESSDQRIANKGKSWSLKC